MLPFFTPFHWCCVRHGVTTTLGIAPLLGYVSVEHGSSAVFRNPFTGMIEHNLTTIFSNDETNDQQLTILFSHVYQEVQPPTNYHHFEGWRFMLRSGMSSTMALGTLLASLNGSRPSRFLGQHGYVGETNR